MGVRVLERRAIMADPSRVLMTASLGSADRIDADLDLKS